MTLRRFPLPLFLVLGILLVAGNGLAQVVKGTIGGVVTDPSGAVIPNAAVTAKEVNTGYLKKATTNGSGVFLFPILNPGDYQVKASAKGFQTLVQNNTHLQVGASVTLN
ncbi:MAG: carboxypeptidase-like regulatory domain-containing protein, partial [Acidobacteriaceae bacterium]